MLKLISKLSTLALVATSLSAFSQNDIRLGYPDYGGNGCPSGTASATLTPDGKTLSIIFDQFVTEAGPGSRKTIDRKNCGISIPVHVPNGLSISIIAAEYRGYVGLPAGATARLTADYWFANSPGLRFARDFHGRTDEDYIFNNDLGIAAIVWSPCGADVNLRVNAGMMVRNTTRQDAIATVDSADFSAGMIYRIQTRRCR